MATTSLFYSLFMLSHRLVLIMRDRIFWFHMKHCFVLGRVGVLFL